MKRLRTHVHVPDGLDWRVFGPGDEVPAVFAALITNPKAWEEETGTAKAASSDGPPPKAGKGSSRDRWAEYASRHGVEVDEDATRDDIVAALDAAGVPTE